MATKKKSSSKTARKKRSAARRPAKAAPKKKAARRTTAKKAKPAKKARRPARKPAAAKPKPQAPSLLDIPGQTTPQSMAPEVEKFYQEEKRLLNTPELSGPGQAPGIEDRHAHHKVSKEDKYAINGIILAIIGVIVPVLSVIGFYLGVVSTKKGSNLGKGVILLSIVTYVLNFIFVIQFMQKLAIGI